MERKLKETVTDTLVSPSIGFDWSRGHMLLISTPGRQAGGMSVSSKPRKSVWGQSHIGSEDHPKLSVQGLQKARP